MNQGETLESEILIKKKTLELLPSAVENIGNLIVSFDYMGHDLSPITSQLLQPFFDLILHTWLKRSDNIHNIRCIGKLQDLCAQGAARLLQLAQEWETHRRPLIAKLRSINSKRTKVSWLYHVHCICT